MVVTHPKALNIPVYHSRIMARNGRILYSSENYPRLSTAMKSAKKIGLPVDGLKK